jgi:hypothetical protein
MNRVRGEISADWVTWTRKSRSGFGRILGMERAEEDGQVARFRVSKSHPNHRADGALLKMRRFQRRRGSGTRFLHPAGIPEIAVGREVGGRAPSNRRDGFVGGGPRGRFFEIQNMRSGTTMFFSKPRFFPNDPRPPPRTSGVAQWWSPGAPGLNRDARIPACRDWSQAASPGLPGFKSYLRRPAISWWPPRGPASRILPVLAAHFAAQPNVGAVGADLDRFTVLAQRIARNGTGLQGIVTGHGRFGVQRERGCDQHGGEDGKGEMGTIHDGLEMDGMRGRRPLHLGTVPVPDGSVKRAVTAIQRLRVHGYDSNDIRGEIPRGFRVQPTLLWWCRWWMSGTCGWECVSASCWWGCECGSPGGASRLCACRWCAS